MPTTRVADGFEWRSGPAGRTLMSTVLAPCAPHVFTTRQLALRGETQAEDEQRLADAFSLSVDRLVRVRQVHGRAVLVVKPGDTLPTAPEADAIVSTDPERATVVYVADCVPILIADGRHRVVAAVHAGWRGPTANVAAATVEVIRSLGVPPGDLVAAIGPSIGPCCYQVDAPVHDAFLTSAPTTGAWFSPDGQAHWMLDLWRANAAQLVDAGVAPQSVHIAEFCTADHLDECWSYRKEGARAGRLAAAIRLAN
jgi:YfiH family protein